MLLMKLKLGWLQILMLFYLADDSVSIIVRSLKFWRMLLMKLKLSWLQILMLFYLADDSMSITDNDGGYDFSFIVESLIVFISPWSTFVLFYLCVE